VNLSLPRDLEEFVRKKVASGQYPDANAVVVEALRELQGSYSVESLSDGTCPPEIKKLLLEAVNGPHHPMPSDYFDKLRERVRANGQK
jgi:Arc/MetJ-type ribon-helix-helix transcriptional regulator